MKKLLLVRHAKSSWSDFSIKDFDRPLNERGKRDAPEMAKRLRTKEIEIDAFISSPAKRARKTAELFTKEFKREKDSIIYFEELYLANPSTFFDIISKIDNSYKTIALFSHNEGITQFANQLTDVQIDDMPTCSVFAVKIKTKDWSDFQEADKEFWFFDSPKKEQEEG
jgi:phosphohistidine phosphatase